MKNKNGLLKKAAKIKLFISDIDGVLTRGEIIVLSSGEEIKIWNVKDGLGYLFLRDIYPEVKTAWITGRGSLQIQERAKDMKIDYLIKNCMTKKEAFDKLLLKTGLKAEETVYIGDDIVDIAVLKAAGLSVCPKDAVSRVKKYVDYVSEFNGGEGAVREVIELILEAKGEIKKIYGKYL
ncbi:MAG: HAD hydrolase family protein [Endomicrobium sp.]|jgi:3-deoxy-D-manno-octulosonate 8-phosphate phosphatase (KDO 8-P phosphatase)|nr:HAD hydrolase family protein [Endomicrobium sp.]